MVEQLTERQSRFVELAAKHADDIATRRAQHDRENSFPFENIEAMKESGYVNITLPEELGGGGANLLEFSLAQERLARGDGATALAVNMHIMLVWVLADMWEHGTEWAGKILKSIARDGSIVFAANADPACDTLASLAGLAYTTLKAERVDGGYRLNGRRVFGTLVPATDLYMTGALYNDPRDGEVLLQYIIPVNTPGIEVQNDWDTMGMRATGSHSIVFKDVFVPDDAVMSRRKPFEWDETIWYFLTNNAIAFSAVYIGIAQAARDFAIEHANKRVRLPFDRPISHYPGNQFLAAEMDIGLKSVRAWWMNVGAHLSGPKGRNIESLMEGIAFQTFCMRTVADVVDKAIELVGAAAIAKRLPLEQYYRDVRAGRFHPLNYYDALGVLGKHAFGIPLDFTPRWL